MAFTIAFSGKGGTGKTTIAALSIRFITEEVRKTVLAVDADPNSSLGLELGVELGGTIADIREDVIKKKVDFPPGMSKETYIDYCIEESIVERNGFDLLTMGRPEGPKCYCYVNNLLRKYLDTAANDYPFVVIDNEAGMEHLSRRTTNDVDILFVVAEPTLVGISSVERIVKITEELPITVRQKAIVLNRVHGNNISEKIRERVEGLGLEIASQIPFDQEVIALSSSGTPISRLSKENEVYKCVATLLERFKVKKC